jgi:oxygen-independent coproporphyrinogen-3 oxidase
MEVMERLYIHVPFCLSGKCGYCAFYSIPWEKNAEEAWLAKIAGDMDSKRVLCGEFRSVYLGGGTPTALSAESLEKLFAHLRKNFNFSSGCEISVECNPETLDVAKAAILSNFANRLSLGVQSFEKDVRMTLGRRARDEEIVSAFELARKAGFENISCDLINSIPGQSLDGHVADIGKAVQAGAKHISSYSLTIEEGTRLARAVMATDEEDELRMWNADDEAMSSHGFSRYEVSNFSKKGFECVHNLEIWFGDKYLGLGPAASSFDGEKRWTESANFAEWLRRAEPEYDIIPREKRAAEILAFGFRTTRAWTREKFKERSGFDIREWDDVLSSLAEDGLIAYDGNSACSTPRGLLMWNSLAERIIEGSQRDG